MAGRVHLSEDGKLRPCFARGPEYCRAKGPSGERARHFESHRHGEETLAREAEEKYGATRMSHRKKDIQPTGRMLGEDVWRERYEEDRASKLEEKAAFAERFNESFGRAVAENDKIIRAGQRARDARSKLATARGDMLKIVGPPGWKEDRIGDEVKAEKLKATYESQAKARALLGIRSRSISHISERASKERIAASLNAEMKRRDAEDAADAAARREARFQQISDRVAREGQARFDV